MGLNLADVLRNRVRPCASAMAASVAWPPAFSIISASLSYPGYGYGINYQFGLFRQTFLNGYQREQPTTGPCTAHPGTSSAANRVR